MSVTTQLDDAATDALRDILADPSLPVATTLTDHPGVDGTRIAALREAHDYLIGRRLGAAVARSAQDGAALIDNLADVDPALAATLRWHSVVVPLLVSLPGSRARNAVLGDVHRGELLTWASSVRSWTWHTGNPPDQANPVGKVDAEIEVDHHPGLYDAILLWEAQSRVLVVIPTHRDRQRWEPVEDGGDRIRWAVHLNRVSLHLDELIPLDTDPRALAHWPSGAPR